VGLTERTLSPRAEDPLSDINLACATTVASTANNKRSQGIRLRLFCYFSNLNDDLGSNVDVCEKNELEDLEVWRGSYVFLFPIFDFYLVGIKFCR
jgi:hypothetical protein